MTNRAIAFLFFIMLVKAGWSAPFAQNVPPEKVNAPQGLKELDKVLFPTRLDGVSPTLGFRLLPKGKPKSTELFSVMETSRDFFPLVLLNPTVKGNPFGQTTKTRLPYNLFLEAQINVLDHRGPVRLQELDKYSKTLKTTSFGITYPLTSKLTLSGRYVVIRGENRESLFPLVGGTYRLNAATSISVSYPDITPENENTVAASASKQNHPTAELKIHF